MGNLCTKTTVNAVDRELLEQQMSSLWDFKILVLGSGESGKSTVVKQIRLVHKGKVFSEEELARFREALLDNVVDCCKAFCTAVVRFGRQFDDEEDAATAKVFMEAEDTHLPLTPELGQKVLKLWRSKAVTEIMIMRDKFWILDSVDWYFANVERFIESDFVPTEEDCVMARVRTTGMVMTEFDQPNQESKHEWDKTIHWRVIDVGGQRNERKKWIHFFDDVKAILFVVNLAGYNMVLFEDDQQNRMMEELELFRQVVNNPVFATTPIFLFLNKKDLFEQKIRKVGLEKCFPDYKGDNSVMDAMTFVANKFRETMPSTKFQGEGENQTSTNDRFHVFMIASRLKMDVKFAFGELKRILIDMNAKSAIKATSKIAKRLDK
ncbi:G-protein alpha subunit [Plasmodiophora brassicae]